MPVSEWTSLGLQRDLLKTLIMQKFIIEPGAVSYPFSLELGCASLSRFLTYQTYQPFPPSTLLFLLTTRNKSVSWWCRCLARHGFRALGCFISYTEAINRHPYLVVCTLLFWIQQSVTFAVTVFPNEQKNLRPERADTKVHIERRRVKQKDFHFSELCSLQCTMMCYHMCSLNVFSSNAMLLGLSSVWVVRGDLADCWKQKAAKDMGQALPHGWPLYY